MMEDRYITIASSATAELKIKGSRFLGECSLVSTVEQAQSVLEAVRSREHAATHHCYAYQIGKTGTPVFKYSDDGEPSGTAGRPIYDLITGRDIRDLIVVITRYYGGTKLGTGGLVKAYSETTRLVLEQAGTKENFIKKQIQVVIDFSLYDQIIRLLHKIGAVQTASDFSDRVKLTIKIRASKLAQLKDEIEQVSSGKAIIDELG